MNLFLPLFQHSTYDESAFSSRWNSMFASSSRTSCPCSMMGSMVEAQFSLALFFFFFFCYDWCSSIRSHSLILGSSMIMLICAHDVLCDLFVERAKRLIYFSRSGPKQLQNFFSLTDRKTSVLTAKGYFVKPRRSCHA